MSISSAMETGVSGLFANSTAIGRVSENIANANTVGYKRRFAEMVTTTASTDGGAGPAGVTAVDNNTVTLGGTLQSTSSPTDLAISGNGFFIVSTSPNDPVQSHYMLTRAGSFSPDANGNLRNSAGYYLAGYEYGSGGTLQQVDRNSFSGMKTVNVDSATIQPSATSKIGVQGNLPSQETGLATPGAPFTSSTEYYNALGATGRILFNWQPTSTPDRWVVSIADDAGNTYGSVTMDFANSGPAAGEPQSYSGVTSTATAPAGFSFNTATGSGTLTVANGSTPQTIQIALGTPGTADGMTQFAGDFTPQTFGKDGAAAGKLASVEVDAQGNLVGVFDNGTRKKLYEIPVGQVTNPNGLAAVNGNAYKLSTAAGAYYNAPTGSGGVGKIVSKTLEGSNVDIAQELTDLIRIQRSYSTNAKIITTMDQILQETAQLKR
ncbi:flagellar hook protein [Defluviimonas sp. 20V17]|uniref:Flagellar hook protein FlgE n=1 Tax=Allgaiera indica TaxID=765699 RepID=A0AAN4ZZ15_9RHOB|nr:flagellar hook protein FlgE [Allgaiera indica]KDB03899.1 flagellar hook protein [Defluviimonas sp. 20V17]GHD99244.1 flagellar hook protein FlgE [Allgaiera indica]SDW30664.1 flagellar hook protein FlgE [Allgaiera indica]